MPADYIIDKNVRLVRIIFTGRVTTAEMYDGRHRMLANPAFDPAFSHLVDARAATTFEMNGYSIKQFAQKQVLTDNARRAIVLSNTPDIGLARMFQIYRGLAGGHEEIQIFQQMYAAIKWLGLPDGYRWK